MSRCRPSFSNSLHHVTAHSLENRPAFPVFVNPRPDEYLVNYAIVDAQLAVEVFVVKPLVTRGLDDDQYANDHEHWILHQGTWYSIRFKSQVGVPSTLVLEKGKGEGEPYWSFLMLLSLRSPFSPGVVVR